jgi:hypothetical protein
MLEAEERRRIEERERQIDEAFAQNKVIVVGALSKEARKKCCWNSSRHSPIKEKAGTKPINSGLHCKVQRPDRGQPEPVWTP